MGDALNPEVSVSSDLIAEFTDVFCSMSSSGEEKGYIMGHKLAVTMEGLGLIMAKPLQAYYSEDGKSEKIYLESFLKNAKTLLGNQPTWMDEDITEAFRYFSPGGKGTNLDAGEMHLFFTHLGEHIDYHDVDSQIKERIAIERMGNALDADRLPADAEMNEKEFVSMWKATHGFTVDVD